MSLENRLNKIGIIKVKILLVKRFKGEKSKLKKFFIYIKLKIRYKRVKLPIIADQVVYIGLFLTGYILK